MYPKITCIFCLKQIGQDCECKNPIGDIYTPLFVTDMTGSGESGVYEDGKVVPVKESKWWKEINEENI